MNIIKIFSISCKRRASGGERDRGSAAVMRGGRGRDECGGPGGRGRGRRGGEGGRREDPRDQALQQVEEQTQTSKQGG